MAKIIFTHRPFQLRRPISWANGLTRTKTKNFTDHVCWTMDDGEITNDSVVYESVVGDGVHVITYGEWIDGRIGTILFVYEIPEHIIDMDVFFIFLKSGTKYDTIALVWLLFGRNDKLKKNATTRQFCSELVANVMAKWMIANGFSDYQNPFWISPGKIQMDLESIGHHPKILTIS